MDLRKISLKEFLSIFNLKIYDQLECFFNEQIVLCVSQVFAIFLVCVKDR